MTRLSLGSNNTASFCFPCGCFILSTEKNEDGTVSADLVSLDWGYERSLIFQSLPLYEAWLSEELLPFSNTFAVGESVGAVSFHAFLERTIGEHNALLREPVV